MSVSAKSATSFALRCIQCQAECEQPSPDFRCAACRNLLQVVYQWPEALRGQQLRKLWLERRLSPIPADQSGVWRFRELLPILSRPLDPVTLREGNTPIYDLPRCAQAAGMRHLLAKHQGMNPTGSFKDTGMTAAISLARERGFQWVACASTGNTSASMAAYAARAGMGSLVLIPEGKIAWGKLAQSLEYGAVTCQLRTDFDGCVRVLSEVVQRLPIYLVNSVNPFRVEGQKTIALEMMEQLNWEVPDHVIVPGGNLANSSALGKAFLEMRELGLISRLPRISIIQAEGANPLVRSLRENQGRELQPVQAETLATAIRIGNPASWKKALAVLRATEGACIDVSEGEMAVAKAEIGSDGIGCEPASAATLAGLKRLVRDGFVGPEDRVVLILTGHMLKDPEYTLLFHRGELLAEYAEAQPSRRPPVLLDANADSVLRVLETHRQPA